MEDELDEYILELEENTKNTRFNRLLTICENIFGPPRISGSHHIFKTPWPLDPRINLQGIRGGKVKQYQVKQVLKALKKRRGQLH